MNRFNKITDLHKAAAIHGKLAMVYHGSRTPPDEFIEFWKEGNFQPGSGSGQARGPGLYTVYEKSETPTEKGGYGSYVYKFILNLDNYLVLVDEEIEKVYPELKGLSYKEKILRQFDRFGIKNKSAEERLNHLSLIQRDYAPHFTSDLASEILDSGLHYGIVYRGEGDGDCCLIQIPEKTKLVGYEAGGKEVRFKRSKIEEINKNHKKLSSRNRSEKDKILEYAEKYSVKAISIINAKISDISMKNKNLNKDFYLNARRIAAKSLVEKNPLEFFRLALQDNYPDLGLPEAKSLVEKNPLEFFRLALQDNYPDLGLSEAKSLVEKDPIKFLSIRLQDNYPDLGLSAAKSLVEKDPDKFFSTKVRGEPLYLDFPHIIEEGLINYSSYYDDMPYYEEIIPLAAEKLSSRDFANVFLLNINSIPFLDKEIGYILYYLLSSEQRERILKDLPDSTLYLLYRKLEQYDLIDNRLFSNDFIKKIPELTAEFDSESFHDLYGEEDLDSELSEKALKNLMDKNFLKWLDKTKLKQYILLKLREKASEEMGRLSDAYLVEAFKGYDLDSYAEEFLDDNYLVLLKEKNGKEEIKEFYYDKNNTPYNEKHVLVSDYIEELLEGELNGLCAGIFIWFLKSKNIYQKDIEDEILNDVVNKYNFNKYYRLGYNYMVETTGIDEVSASSGERYMHEAEGIYEEDDNLYEDGYNPFGKLFYRQKTREEVGEELEDDPDLINEYEFENDEDEEDELEDEVFDKFSKLYKYLVTSGFLKESEDLSELTKTAVLKKLKRTTRGKGKKDRMEWALVSKSNPKKILKWFGPKKPSKKQVAKEERRIHAFK